MEGSSQHARSQLCLDVIAEVLSYFDPLVLGPATAPDILRRLIDWRTSPASELAQIADENRKTLARCARVCRDWSQPALTLLWSVLPNGPGPLVHALTNSEGVCFKTSRDGVKFVDLRGLSDAGWQRWMWYASLVRYLLFHHWIRPDSSDPAVFNAALDRNGCVPLFKNLRVLTWRSSQYASRAAVLRSVACTDLIMFCIVQGDGTANTVEADLGTIRVACTRLQHLHVWPHSVRGPSGLLEPFYYIPAFSKLRSLDLGNGANGEILARLARLSRLSTLIVRKTPLISGDVDLEALTNTFTNMPSRSFRALRTLSMSGAPVFISAFLSHISPDRLTSLSCDVESPHKLQKNDPFHIFALPYISRSLTSLHLCIKDRTASLTQRSLYEIIQPLMPTLRLVTDVTLSLPQHIVCVTDEDLNEVAHAWPRLVRFVLRVDDRIPPSRGQSIDHPSFMAVVRLACACAELNTLHVESRRLTGDDKDALDAMLSDGAQHRNLRTLDLLAGSAYDMLTENHQFSTAGIYMIQLPETPGGPRSCWYPMFRNSPHVRVDHNAMVDSMRRLFPRAKEIRFESQDDTLWYCTFDADGVP